jgi:hypothetical protein
MKYRHKATGEVADVEVDYSRRQVVATHSSGLCMTITDDTLRHEYEPIIGEPTRQDGLDVGVSGTVRHYLQHQFPEAAPGFIDLSIEEMNLHNRKNHDYAHGGGDPLGNFKRVAAIFAVYPGLDLAKPEVVCLVYAMKQVDAILWQESQGHEAKAEGWRGRAQDVGNYIGKLYVLLKGK